MIVPNKKIKIPTLAKLGQPLTTKQVAYYLSRAGVWCPYCGGADVASGKPDCDGDSGWANVECENCGAEWVDRWSLTGIEAADKQTETRQ